MALWPRAILTSAAGTEHSVESCWSRICRPGALPDMIRPVTRLMVECWSTLPRCLFGVLLSPISWIRSFLSCLHGHAVSTLMSSEKAAVIDKCMPVAVNTMPSIYYSCRLGSNTLTPSLSAPLAPESTNSQLVAVHNNRKKTARLASRPIACSCCVTSLTRVWIQ